jgi:hypothetical protein
MPNKVLASKCFTPAEHCELIWYQYSEEPACRLGFLITENRLDEIILYNCLNMEK